MKEKAISNPHRWKKRIRSVFCISFIVSSILAMKAYAAEVPSFFTVESIMQEGIEDRNFAEAIYESIAWEIQHENYSINETWTVKDIVENFSDNNLNGKKAIIDAVDKNIKSIKGIKLFKNEVEIYLEGNEIHDLTPLQRDINTEDKIYFNGTVLRMGGENFQNIVPKELIGSRNGNYTIDSTMDFDLVSLNYIYNDINKEVDLDFGVVMDGIPGGIFNKEYTDNRSVSLTGVTWTDYADNKTRFTGTKINIANADGDFLICANANENEDSNEYLPPTIRYWTSENVYWKLNLEWRYPFRTKFYRTLKNDFTPVIYSGVKLIKQDPDGNPLSGAKYILWKTGGGSRTRYPDDSTEYTTDADGKLVISDLPAGTYEIQEIESPKGYKLDTVPRSFSVGETASGYISSSVSGGDAEAIVTSDDAEYAPVWDSVEELDENGQLVRKHKMRLTKGSTASVTSASLGVDALISNHGNGLTLLKGEILDNSVISLVPEESMIRLYAGDSLLGVFNDPSEARSTINSMIETGAFDSSKGNVSVDAKIVYRESESEYPEIVHVNTKEPEPGPEPEPEPEPPVVPAEKTTEITVKKIWSEEDHPEEAYFQLFTKKEDGTVRMIGKSKKADRSTDFRVSWSYTEIRSGTLDTASASNASAGTASPSDASPSDASPSDASAALYDEDGFLLDGLVIDDLEEDLYVEETQIPEGWEPVYSIPETDGDGKVVFTVKNRRIPEEPEKYRKEEPDEEPDEEPEKDRPSGSSGPSGGGNPMIEVTEPPRQTTEELIPEQEVLGANRAPTRKIQGLPYGMIASSKIPSMGEETEDEEKRAGLLLAGVFLAALIGTGCGIRRKNRGVNGNGN